MPEQFNELLKKLGGKLKPKEPTKAELEALARKGRNDYLKTSSQVPTLTPSELRRLLGE